jgi:ACT domain-containing protein
VGVLKQAEVGVPVAELIRKVGISEQTFYRWKKQRDYVSYCTSMLAQCTFVASHLPRRCFRSEVSNGESVSGGS